MRFISCIFYLNRIIFSPKKFDLHCCNKFQEIDPIILSVGEEDEVSIMDAVHAVVKAFDFKVSFKIDSFKVKIDRN